ncbi:hypothetical protein [Aliivibrio fischeri]|uniref:hypothetical protein n=1 Tax=Aliivibrio fischeri TaxID=668 RepID=UPI0012D8E9A8|nr:hypothetical protein [Aliivibrio fischeri]MUK69215.1 hypothetical protein [Aliivibrio fischeri]MUK71749.1 hypothetical protein [Aliivibrio fischeri]MUK78246.1 hypothetical protein [Aliivibrio fischeri]
MKSFLIYLTFSVFLTSSYAYSKDKHLELARLSLKNYGLVNCIYNGLKEENKIQVDDIGSASRVFGFMGQGYYKIEQDKVTFEELHNPYREVNIYMKSRYNKIDSYLKNGTNNVTVRCLMVFDSLELKKWIKEQDKYINDINNINLPYEIDH